MFWLGVAFSLRSEDGARGGECGDLAELQRGGGGQPAAETSSYGNSR
jgi:hypothetical protein